MPVSAYCSIPLPSSAEGSTENELTKLKRCVSLLAPLGGADKGLLAPSRKKRQRTKRTIFDSTKILKLLARQIQKEGLVKDHPPPSPHFYAAFPSLTENPRYIGPVNEFQIFSLSDSDSQKEACLSKGEACLSEGNTSLSEGEACLSEGPSGHY